VVELKPLPSADAEDRVLRSFFTAAVLAMGVNSTSQVLNLKKAKSTSSCSPGFAVNFGKFAGVEMSPPVYVRRTMARSRFELQIARSPVLRYGMAAFSVSMALGGRFSWSAGFLREGMVHPPGSLPAKVFSSGQPSVLRLRNGTITDTNAGVNLYEEEGLHSCWRDAPFAVTVEASQEEHRLAGDVCDTRLGNGDARFLREGQCDRLPNHRVDFIVLAWEFRDGEMAVLIL
jgi:hypothetical protein